MKWTAFDADETYWDAWGVVVDEWGELAEPRVSRGVISAWAEAAMLINRMRNEDWKIKVQLAN
jgi:hypothetical protein